jgi:hypothetical protein
MQQKAESDCTLYRLGLLDVGRPSEFQRHTAREAQAGLLAQSAMSGHVAANPPLTTHELAAFKAGVSVLAGFVRLLARSAREAARTGVLTRDLQHEFKRSRALVSEVEKRMHDFAQAALVSWESRVD